MIDPSIYKVYKQEKKVFIPDFGAIIYSEATDSIDFNELLTFDDGKVIEEIQSRQKSGKREARKALKEHIKKVKAKLDDGKTHLIRGLGYLYKDESGSYAIQKNKPGSKSSTKKKPKKDKGIPVAAPPETIDKEALTAEPGIQVDEIEKAAEAEEIENIVEEDSSLDDELKEETLESEQEVSFESEDTQSDFESNEEFEKEQFSEETENQAGVDDEDDEYAYKPYLSQEDEDVQDYYKRKDDYYNEGNNRAKIWYMIAAAIVLLLIAGGLYYFVFDSDDNNGIAELTMVADTDTDESADDEDTENASTAEGTVESAKDQQNDETTENMAAAQETTTATQTPSTLSNPDIVSNSRTYSLILGSFQVDENANNFHKYLTDKQRDVSIFNWGGSFQFVGFERIEGKDEALKLLAEMREEEEPTAWIIRNRQN